jgi:lysyl-tRNA synthetase class II
MKKTICVLSLVVALGGIPFVTGLAQGQSAPTKTPPTATKQTPAKTETAKSESASKEADKGKGILDHSYRELNSPLDLVKDADKWIDEKISFQATFVAFSPYALDYKGAMRASKEYIAFLIQRPDVNHHVIPLSELKLIYPRKKADEVVELESGDTVLVKGKVFSAALGDPWVDVDEVVLLKKSPENEAKAKSKSKKNQSLEE